MALAVFVIGALLTAGGAASAGESAKPPSIDVLSKCLGHSEEDKAALLSGKIIATDLTRTRDDQLIAAVAVQLSASIAVLGENARKGLNLERGQDVMAFGKLTGEGGPTPSRRPATRSMTATRSKS